MSREGEGLLICHRDVLGMSVRHKQISRSSIFFEKTNGGLAGKTQSRLKKYEAMWFN